MPSAGVLQDAEHGSHTVIEEFVKKPRLRIGSASHRARRGRVDHGFLAELEISGKKRHEVRALLALYIDDLNDLALGELVGAGGAATDDEFVTHLAQRFGEIG